MRAKEREPFIKLLIERRKMLTGDVSQMKVETLSKSRKEASGDISAMPLHMADIGSENFEQEFPIGLVETEEDELREIGAALERVENGTYATCEGCEKSIAKSMLKAIPYARLCISCQREEESQSGSGALG